MINNKCLTTNTTVSHDELINKCGIHTAHCREDMKHDNNHCLSGTQGEGHIYQMVWLATLREQSSFFGFIDVNNFKTMLKAS